jgi:hypothetical protein
MAMARIEIFVEERRVEENSAAPLSSFSVVFSLRLTLVNDENGSTAEPANKIHNRQNCCRRDLITGDDGR